MRRLYFGLSLFLPGTIGPFLNALYLLTELEFFNIATVNIAMIKPHEREINFKLIIVVLLLIFLCNYLFLYRNRFKIEERFKTNTKSAWWLGCIYTSVSILSFIITALIKAKIL